MVDLAWFALYYDCFSCRTEGGEDICNMLQCLEIADIDLFLMFRYRLRMLVRVYPRLLVMPEALPHTMMETTCCLMIVMMLCAMWPRVKAMVLCVMLLKITPTWPSMNEAVRCDERYQVWCVIGDLFYLNLNSVFDLRRSLLLWSYVVFGCYDFGHPLR
jgi:hypothetical protein